MTDLRHLVLARHLDGDVHQIADDAVDFAPDVSHLGEFRRLDLDKRRPCQFRQASGDLGLADTGRTDHQDILRRDFAAKWLVDLHTSPAIAKGDRDSAFGVILADDVLVQFLDDFSGGHLGH